MDGFILIEKEGDKIDYQVKGNLQPMDIFGMLSMLQQELYKIAIEKGEQKDDKEVLD